MHITQISCIIGLSYIFTGLALALGGNTVRNCLKLFPRHRIAGIILAAAAIGWTALLLWHSPLGWFEPYRHTLPYLAAAICLLAIILADELLAPRALGGLLLLVAAPVLNAIRWEPTAWRLALTVQAYIWVIAGMMFVFSPHLFRRMCNWTYASPRRTKLIAWTAAAVGAFNLVLGATVYRSLIA